MIRASRLRLPPPRKPVPVIPLWVIMAVLVSAAIACWSLHFAVAAVVFAAMIILILTGLIATRFEIARRSERVANLPSDSTCSYARSFAFRQADTLVMRAVYEELQPTVTFPIQASHGLVEDLRLDDEDLNLDFAPIIAQRLHRTLKGSEKNPYYGRVYTVEDLVRFMEAQPSDNTEKT
jgi:hypothetical protein